MSDWSLHQELIKQGLSLCVTMVGLGAGWLIGQKLSYGWNVRQKRREFQLAASQQFYAAYGEFFATWKLWNRLERDNDDFEARRWELHKRAAAAEATVEGILVKLSSELLLTEVELENLGCFRQAFQQLRQSIRERAFLPWGNSENPKYVAFKTYATKVSHLMTREWARSSPDVARAAEQLLRVTSNSWEQRWLTLGKAPE